MSESTIEESLKNAEEHKIVSPLVTFFGSWRIGRILMLAFVTSSVTYGFGGQWRDVGLAIVIGATLSAGGFFLDYLMDYKKDRSSGKLTNPLAIGAIKPWLAIIIIVVSLGISLALCVFTNPWSLLPFTGVILIIVGQGIGILDSPFLRAFGLGILQGLYVLIGAFIIDNYYLGVFLLALFLLFAMTGGRILGDARDLPYDQKTTTQTIPKKYGLRFASYFLLINELISYGIALSVYFTGVLNIRYLYCIIVLISSGLILTIIFLVKPTPKIGNITNILSFSFLGSLFVLGLILGRIS